MSARDEILGRVRAGVGKDDLREVCFPMLAAEEKLTP